MTLWGSVGLARDSLHTAVDKSPAGSDDALDPPIPYAARSFGGVEPPAGSEFGP